MVSIGHVVPLRKTIEIDIPPDYINKEIEILIFPVEKSQKQDIQQKGGIRALKGILGKVEFTPEMKEKAWESAVEEKFLPD